MTNCVGNHQPSDNPDWQWPTATTGLLCHRCRSRLSSLLIQMPSLAAWLEENIATSSNPNGPKISGSREDPIPLRPDVLDFVGPDSLKAAVTPDAAIPEYIVYADRRHVESCPTWREAELVRDTMMRQLGLDPNDKKARYSGRVDIRPTLPGGSDQCGEDAFRALLRYWAGEIHALRGVDWPTQHDISSMARWIHSQLDWLTTWPRVSEIIEELSEISRKAERLAPRDPEHRWLKPPCPSCNRKALVFTRGVGVACETKIGGCGRTWTDTEMDRLILVLGTEAMEATG